MQIRYSIERLDLIQRNWILTPVPILFFRSFQVGISIQESFDRIRESLVQLSLFQGMGPEHFSFLFVFLNSALSIELEVRCSYATTKTFDFKITKNKSMSLRCKIYIIAYDISKTTSHQASDHSLVTDFPKIYSAYLKMYFSSYLVCS